MAKKLKAELNIDIYGNEFYWILDFRNKEIDSDITSCISSRREYKTLEAARIAGKNFAIEYGIKVI